MPSFPVVSIELSEAEREQLESWSRRWTTAHSLAQRSKIVLLVADGLRTGEIAERLDVHRNTVGKWRRRFEAERLDGQRSRHWCPIQLTTGRTPAPSTRPRLSRHPHAPRSSTARTERWHQHLSRTDWQ